VNSDLICKTVIMTAIKRADTVECYTAFTYNTAMKIDFSK